MLTPEKSMSPEFGGGAEKKELFILKRNRTEFLMPVEFGGSRESNSSRIMQSITVPGCLASQTWLRWPWIWDKRKNDHLKQKMGVTQIPVLLSIPFSSYTHLLGFVVAVNTTT